MQIVMQAEVREGLPEGLQDAWQIDLGELQLELGPDGKPVQLGKGGSGTVLLPHHSGCERPCSPTLGTLGVIVKIPCPLTSLTNPAKPPHRDKLCIMLCHKLPCPAAIYTSYVLLWYCLIARASK